MYKPLLFAAGLLAVFHCRSQVTMTLQVPPTGVLFKSQLWNMSLVYTGNNQINVKINLTLSDASGDQPLLTASSGVVVLNTGAKQLQANDLTPIQYNYLSPVIFDRDPNGYLTAGSYQACYTVLVSDESSGTPLAEDCVTFEVDPLSPPVLNTPADGDTLQTNIPQFTWLPPTPLNLFYNLSYQFNLVEVLSGQNPADAIQQNIPVYVNNNCSDIFMNYPSSAMALDTGKLYAWQVIAQNNFQPSAQSEVWTFRIKGTTFSLPPSDESPFIKLKREQDASIAVCTGNVKFYYTNDAGDSTVNYQITHVDANDAIEVVDSAILSLSFGENQIVLPFVNDNRLLNNGTYLFELVNSRNETWSMKFVYKEPILKDQQ